MMLIRDVDQFLSDLDAVWTNPPSSVGGHDLSSGQENTLHEYCHFVTLGLRAEPCRGTYVDPDIYARVVNHLAKLVTEESKRNEIRTLAAQLVIMKAIGAFRKSGSSVGRFLEAVQRMQGITGLESSVLRLSKTKQARSDARRVVRRIRLHAKTADKYKTAAKPQHTRYA